MNKKINSFLSASPGVWMVRLIITACIVGIIVIELGLYFARPLVTAHSVNLRSSPQLSAKLVSRINTGTRLKVIKKNESTEWWYVKANGHTGWIASWLIDQPKYNAKTADKISEATIVLDPGHGGQDTGTLSHFGSGANNEEKTYTLPLALRVRDLLKPTFARVIMSRTSDKTVGLQDRANLSNHTKANLFMSFHYNSSNVANDATGFEVFKYHRNADIFAEILNNNFANLPLTNRGVSFGNYLVLRNNTQPAVLIEMGFMDNTRDLQYIRNASYRNQVAQDVVKSMNQYFDAE
ncbi:N-acetylmuramoyl-L-alanine amidase [Nicoliella spurrieriana]|uniref:N-acetylmuramoyl-L-alanine amidase n=1 Tax=Nicoliella spurrieriana TaxID=2925830 RepID=A0A976X679_9LACO|nr:N-acetylmuramoyl-L-alanine amidase [Nicoliella spurrieriana]UQS87212.1 N-acetylmuramoyl-L-alanine amidase [Nicoliella spurrieriana]